MSSRPTLVLDRIRTVSAATEGGTGPVRSEAYIDRWYHRAKLLGNGVYLSLCSGSVLTLLLAVFFGSKFFDLKYAYGGAGLLFSTATVLLGFALVGFAQEAWVGLREIDLERQELSDKAR